MKNNNTSLITITFVLLGVYNILYWPAKFYGAVPGFYREIKYNWYLFILLELLAVASLFVDVIVRWDKFGNREKRLRIILTAFFLIAFISRFVFGYMEDYFEGEVN